MPIVTHRGVTSPAFALQLQQRREVEAEAVQNKFERLQSNLKALQGGARGTGSVRTGRAVARERRANTPPPRPRTVSDSGGSSRGGAPARGKAAIFGGQAANTGAE